MSQRKKKQQTQQELKHMAAQYRADFFRKMKFVIDNVCGTDIYPLIPQSVLDNSYVCRSAPFKIVPAYNNNISSKYLKDSKVILPRLIKNHNISLPPSNIEITLYDYYTVVFTIVILNAHISETSFNQADKVKASLQKIIDDTATNDKANNQMYNTLYSYNLGESNLSKMLYWCKHDNIIPKKFPAETENIITIYSVTPETIQVTLEEGTRPAIRVGWAFAYTGAEWIMIKPSVLGFKSPFAEIPLKVYIQQHALNRLTERIDCFWQGIVQFNMYCSLITPKFAYDNNNNLLIEYSFFGNKAGYFRADIIDGIILLRTFLFVTNNGTPEGQLLEKNTGLQKLDKKYLNIDKLSTYMNSDLDTNTKIQQIFKNSGCQCLIDLYNNTKPLLIKKDNNFDFNLMLSYLNVNNNDTITNNTTTQLQLTNN